MLDDVVGAAERGEDVHETKHLHLERFVPHRESHHLLVETGFAEDRFGMLIDQLENSLATPFDGGLQGAHRARIKRLAPFGKAGDTSGEKDAWASGEENVQRPTFNVSMKKKAYEASFSYLDVGCFILSAGLETAYPERAVLNGKLPPASRTFLFVGAYGSERTTRRQTAHSDARSVPN